MISLDICKICNKDFNRTKNSRGIYCSKICAYSDPELKEKLRLIAKSPERRAKISAALKGRIVSDEMKKKISLANQGRIFSPEQRLKLMGRVPWNKGIKRTDIAREKHPSWNGNKPKCPVCDKELARQRNKTCAEHRPIRYQIGETNPNWKGGVSLLKKSIRACFKYRQWRSDVFTRDDFTCQTCGMKGRNLEVDHVKPFAKIMEENKIISFQQAMDCEEFWNINNGQVLCIDCHLKKTYG